MELDGGRRKRGSRFPLGLVLLLLIVGGGVVGGILTFRAGDPPKIDISSRLPAIGKKNTFTIKVTEPKRGITAIKIELEQGKLKKVLAEKAFPPAPAWDLFDSKPKTVEEVLLADVGRAVQKNLKQGKATVRVTASGAGTWMVQPEPVVESVEMEVRIVPPSLEVKSDHIYITQGGCEVVVYQVGKTSVKDGVRAGKFFFPGYPLPDGGEQDRFAFFAVPYDMDSDEGVKLVAIDDVENELGINFIDIFKPNPFKTDTITVTDKVMAKIVTKMMAKMPSVADSGSMLENYLAINRDMRQENSKTIEDLASKTEQAFLWNKPFVQMSAKVVSSFADRRTYLHKGKKVDRQDHLGIDLASTRRAPIPAANGGVVLLAEYFGIYGNAVVIDHGYGLMSLYGHMSSIDVAVGHKVKRSQTIGKTGATGLALGDHLHFTMVLHGLPVTPIEWWDSHWIHDRIALKLGDALKFEAGQP